MAVTATVAVDAAGTVGVAHCEIGVNGFGNVREFYCW